MERNEIIHGFAVTSCRGLPELDGKLWQMEHRKSGARLVWLERPDSNKTFAITFRTTPEDDTGVFHILEHSVLSGSERYPVKEPFLELMKSSMYTFLNAMTFPDKTVYPVSSRNPKDFVNLVRVYMDGVLHPLIYSRPEIFRQEGWHYELSDDGGDPVYNGVVYNEMKGALASPDTLLQNELSRRLFPDACYCWVSGGDPAHIPDLTYEAFLDYHRRYYHPSNSYIFLDGQLDIEHILGILDGEFLSGFTRRDAQPPLVMQPAVKAEPACIYYEISPDESPIEKASLAWGYVLGDYGCREKQVAMRALADVLCGSNESPLVRCVLSAGLAQDVEMSVIAGIQQPFVLLKLENMDETGVSEARDAICKELTRQINGGLDHGQLTAALANLEFHMRERDYGSTPRGLAFGMSVLDSWLYGGDPAANLEVGELFDSLNRKVDEGWFEGLLERIFLQNDHTCQVLLLPSAVLGEETQREETARLRAAKAGWSQEEEAVLHKQQEALLTWQTGEDTRSALAAVPSLQLSDVAERPEAYPLQVDTLRNVPLLRYDLAAGGVGYINLYFDVSDLSAEEMSLASLLTSLLGELDTEHYGSAEIQRLCRQNTGSIQFGLETYSQPNAPETCRAYLCASFSAVESRLDQAAALAAELLLASRFDDRKKIRELLRQYLSQTEQSISAYGSNYAVARVSAGYSSEGAIQEYITGITYYQWLKTLERAFEARAPKLQEDLDRLCRRIFTAGRLTVSITGAGSHVDSALENNLLDRLPLTARQELTCVIKPWGRRREGIVIPGDVAFAALGGSLLRCGAPYSGTTQVMSRIVSLVYLWNMIRVQGGAYGAGFAQGGTGSACFHSFRDPNAAHSLSCYRQAPDFLEQFCAEGADLTGFITGAVSATEPLLLPRQQGKASDGWYLRGITYADRCRIRHEMLSVTPNDLSALATPLRELIQTSSICVIGSRRQLENCGEELDTLAAL